MSDKVLEIVERETGRKVVESTPLEELGIDSLEFMALILAIDEETGVSIPNDRLGDLHTVQDMIEIVAAG